MREYKVNEHNRCRNCGHHLPLGTAMGEGDPKPAPGDFSICISCGTLSVFTLDMGLREPTLDEFEALSPSTRGKLKFAQALIQAKKKQPN